MVYNGILLLSIIATSWRCLWCNGYRRRKRTRRYKFKSWTRLIAFHIALIPLGKVWIQLFSLQLWVNSWADCVLQPWWGNLSRRRKTLNSNLLNSAKKIDQVSYPARAEGLGKYDNSYIMLLMFTKDYFNWKNEVVDHSRGRPEGTLFNSYNTEMFGRAPLRSLDCSSLPLIRTL